MKVIQRSPDLGIGIRLKKLAPEVVVPEPEPPVDIPLSINITTETVSSAGGTTTLTHTVGLSKAFDTDQEYPYSLEDLTSDASDYTIDSVVFSDGVTEVGGVLTVPAGVTEFTVEVTITAATLFHIKYQVQISNVFGVGNLLGA